MPGFEVAGLGAENGGVAPRGSCPPPLTMAWQGLVQEGLVCRRAWCRKASVQEGLVQEDLVQEGRCAGGSVCRRPMSRRASVQEGRVQEGRVQEGCVQEGRVQETGVQEGLMQEGQSAGGRCAGGPGAGGPDAGGPGAEWSSPPIYLLRGQGQGWGSIPKSSTYGPVDLGKVWGSGGWLEGAGKRVREEKAEEVVGDPLVGQGGGAPTWNQQLSSPSSGTGPPGDPLRVSGVPGRGLQAKGLWAL